MSTAKEALLQACEDANCDGVTHLCGACGGEGYDSDQEGVDEGWQRFCPTCNGDGGWPCPLASPAP